MPTLKDYLGCLVKDINYARVIADVESANIAKMYAEHDLLKYFSIPRMKIQDTELTIPIAIDELEQSAEKDYQPINNTDFYAKTYAEIKNVFKISSFNREVSTPLRKLILSHIDTLEKTLKSDADIKTSLFAYCKNVSESTIKILSSNEPGRPVYEKAVSDHSAADEEQIRDVLTNQLAKYLEGEIKAREFTGKIENARVTVESDKLREKRPESLMYIKLKITEESMEWQTIEDAEGNIVKKLAVE